MNIDWNATAAWIALCFSIITPSITTIINLFHQRRMKRIEEINKAYQVYIAERTAVINQFFKAAGITLADFTNKDATTNLCASFFQVYQYVEKHHWEKLNSFYKLISDASSNRKEVIVMYCEITKILTETASRKPLKSELPLHKL